MSKNLVIGAVAVIAITALAFSLYAITRNNARTSSSAESSSITSSLNYGIGRMMSMMNMGSIVTDEKSFISNMLPHHQEAIDTSEYVLARTQDNDLRSFLQQVISAQSKEIADMKTWYAQWYSQDLPKTNYTPMMGDLTNYNGTQLDQAYIRGMIMHHRGAVSMARKVLTLNPRDELRVLATTIITAQEKEINQLSGWLMSKYNDHTMMGM